MGKSAFAALITAVSLSFFNSAYANGEPQGCTPGYWKNHTDAWVTYESHHSVMDVLVFPPQLYNEFAGITIHQALSLKGGQGRGRGAYFGSPRDRGVAQRAPPRSSLSNWKRRGQRLSERRNGIA